MSFATNLAQLEAVMRVCEEDCLRLEIYTNTIDRTRPDALRRCQAMEQIAFRRSRAMYAAGAATLGHRYTMLALTANEVAICLIRTHAER